MPARRTGGTRQRPDKAGEQANLLAALHPDTGDHFRSSEDLDRFPASPDAREANRPAHAESSLQRSIPSPEQSSGQTPRHSRTSPKTWLATWDASLALTFIDPAKPAWCPATGESPFGSCLRAALDGTGNTVDQCIAASDGRLHLLQVRFVPQFVDGKVTAVQGLFSDLTDYDAAEQRLSLLETCLSRLNDIVLITEAEPFEEPGPRIVYVNDAFEQRTGYKRDEVIGRTPRMLQGPDTDAAELHRIGAALRAWKSVRSELINYRKSGEPFWLELDIVPVANELGWYTHWIAIERDITERKRAELSLREAEERLRFALDSADIGDWNMDLRTNVATRSLQHDRCFGYTEPVAEWGYDTFLDHVHPSDRERVDQTYRAALDGGREYDAEFRVIWPDQSIHWLWSKGRFYFDDSGVPYRVAGIQVDVTKRRLAEAQRRDSARRLEIVTDTANLGWWEWNLTTDKVYLSPVWKRQLGYENHELADNFDTWRSRVHPDDVERALAATSNLAGGTATDYELEHRLRHRDGTYRVILTKATLIYDESGQAQRMLGSNLDLTEIRGAEAARRESDLTLQGVIENSPVPYILSDASGDILYLNRAFTTVLGYTPADVPTIAKFRKLAFSAPKYRQWAATEIAARTVAAERGANFEPLEVRISCKDKSIRTFLLRVIALSDTGTTRQLKVLFDVTDQRELEQALIVAASREQHRLGLDLHDGLGQELTGLSLMLAALSRRVLIDDRPSIVREMEHLSSLASGCVNSARLIAHGLSPVSLANGGFVAALARLVTTVHAITPDIDVRLDANGIADHVVSAAAAEATYRIAQEALSNAIRHGKATFVIINAVVDDEELQISIADNGRGLPKIIAGDGMGMNIMRYRARALGGTVEFARSALGGVSVNCVIPLRAASAGSATGQFLVHAIRDGL